MLRLTPRLVHAAQLAALTLVSLVAFAGAGSTGAATTPGLVAAYSFDAGTGTTLADSSGLANTGTISGATWAAGKNGGALTFDGVNDSVTVPDTASLDLSTGMTIEAWVRPDRDRRLAHGRSEGDERQPRLRPLLRLARTGPGPSARSTSAASASPAAAAALPAERMDAPRDHVRRRLAPALRQRRARLGTSTFAGAMATRPAPSTSAATRSGRSGSAAGSTTSASTTVR